MRCMRVIIGASEIKRPKAGQTEKQMLRLELAKVFSVIQLELIRRTGDLGAGDDRLQYGGATGLVG
jgi:hypothetical protein